MLRLNGLKRGFCRALDLGGKSKDVFNVTVRDNDYNVLAGDWENVGRDIRTAIRRSAPGSCR